MIRLTLTLALLVAVSACTDVPEVARTPAPCADYRFHGALQENGCVFDVEELLAERERSAYPVWVFSGYLQEHKDGFRLHVEDNSTSAFVELDLANLPDSETPYGLEPLISWRTRIIGYYTSSDVATPSTSGAAGTLQVLRIGYIGDPARPRGAYDTAALEAVKAEMETKAGTGHK